MRCRSPQKRTIENTTRHPVRGSVGFSWSTAVCRACSNPPGPHGSSLKVALEARMEHDLRPMQDQKRTRYTRLLLRSTPLSSTQPCGGGGGEGRPMMLCRAGSRCSRAAQEHCWVMDAGMTGAQAGCASPLTRQRSPCHPAQRATARLGGSDGDRGSRLVQALWPCPQQQRDA